MGGVKLHKYYIKLSEHHAKKICINNLYSLATIYLAYFFLLSSALQGLSVYRVLYILRVCLFGLIWSKYTSKATRYCMCGQVCVQSTVSISKSKIKCRLLNSYSFVHQGQIKEVMDDFLFNGPVPSRGKH